jgi:hypothetical protein
MGKINLKFQNTTEEDADISFDDKGILAKLLNTLENVQTSVMTEPVKAYVFRNPEGNIYRVFEPVRGNDIKCSHFTYEETIDQFNFSNLTNVDNVLSDVKLVYCNEMVFQQVRLQAMVIKCGGPYETLTLRQYAHSGTYGIADPAYPNNAEISTSGTSNSIIEGVEASGNTCFDSIYENVSIKNCTFNNFRLLTGSHPLTLQNSVFESNSKINIVDNGASFIDGKMEANSLVYFYSGAALSKIAVRMNGLIEVTTNTATDSVEVPFAGYLSI